MARLPEAIAKRTLICSSLYHGTKGGAVSAMYWLTDRREHLGIGAIPRTPWSLSQRGPPRKCYGALPAWWFNALRQLAGTPKISKEICQKIAVTGKRYDPRQVGAYPRSMVPSPDRPRDGDSIQGKQTQSCDLNWRARRDFPPALKSEVRLARVHGCPSGRRFFFFRDSASARVCFVAVSPLAWL
jgi:hypothetical protein